MYRSYIVNLKKVWKNDSQNLKNTRNYGAPQWPFWSAYLRKLKPELQAFPEWETTPYNTEFHDVLLVHNFQGGSFRQIHFA